MRNYYQSQINKLDTSLIEMGSLLESAIENAMIALKNGDRQAVRDAKAIEREIDQKEKELETMCLKLILHQQPVARDFHLISAALKLITDMERIGDQADDIAVLSSRLTTGRDSNVMDLIIKMGKETSKMVTGSIDSYVKRDMNLAVQVTNADDVVDSLFIRAKEEIVQLIKSDGEIAEDAPDLLMIAKYFEGIGDHAVKIAEWVVFAFTGNHNMEESDSQSGNPNNINNEALEDMM